MEMNTLSGETILSKSFFDPPTLPPSDNGSTLKGKSLLLEKSFLLRLTPVQKLTGIQEIKS